jgi:hypothetical protein
MNYGICRQNVVVLKFIAPCGCVTPVTPSMSAEIKILTDRQLHELLTSPKPLMGASVAVLQLCLLSRDHHYCIRIYRKTRRKASLDRTRIAPTGRP